MSANKKIREHYNEARRLALAEVVHRARTVMRDHAEAHEFIMAMGQAFFVKKNGDDLQRAYMNPVMNFLDEWDSYLKLTGTPMRFTATGPIVRDW